MTVDGTSVAPSGRSDDVVVPTLAALVEAMNATEAAYQTATAAWVVAGELAQRADDRRRAALEARDAAIDNYRRNRVHAEGRAR